MYIAFWFLNGWPQCYYGSKGCRQKSGDPAVCMQVTVGGAEGQERWAVTELLAWRVDAVASH